MLTTGDQANDPAIYGDYTNTFILEKDDIVEIVLNNDDAGKHPFHLHGHNFQTVVRSDEEMGHYNPVNETNFPAQPMRRDTLMVRPNSNFVVRFRADNPGMSSSLRVISVEADAVLQESGCTFNQCRRWFSAET